MPGPYDWAQTKQSMPVQGFGGDRGTGGYARRGPVMDMGARSRFGAMAPQRPPVGGGMDGPPRQALNMPPSPSPGSRPAMPGGGMLMPPPGVVQGNRGVGGDPNAMAARQQMAQKLAAARAAGGAPGAPTPPPGMPAGAQRVAGPGMAGLAQRLAPGQEPPAGATRLPGLAGAMQRPPV